ncbi:MAG: hypothetical protein KF718_12760 [Polyangiaceae bacterium]|nr:hypothetical protein [Polyangiaceae bacterium]
MTRSLARWPRLSALLASPRMVVLAAALGALLCASSVPSGFATEDYLFRAGAQLPFDWSRINLFDARDVRYGVADARAHGTLPWLAADELSISFWRPLTSLTHHLDYRVFPHQPTLAHLHSLLWYALCVAAVGLGFRRVLPGSWLAGLATLLFSVDQAHGHAVGWLSNRHVLLGTAFGALSLMLHLVARAGDRRAKLAAPACLGLALACSESALGALGYLLAYAALLDRGPRRLLSLTPYALVLAAWIAVFRGLGHGARASALYIDPAFSPLEFSSVLPERVGVLLLAQLGGPSAELWHVSSPLTRATLAALGFAALGLCIAVASRRRTALFFACGLVLSLVPQAATFPSDRSLWLSGIGGFGLVALVVERAVRVASPARMVAALLLTLHAVVSPLGLPGRSLAMARLHADVERASDAAYGALPERATVLVLVTAPDLYFCRLLRDLRYTRGLPARPLLCLTGTLGPLELERVDPNALRVRVPAGYLDRPFNQLYRDRHHPLRVGDSLFTGTASVTVEATTPEGGPTVVLFRFLTPLEDERLAWMHFGESGPVRWTPPAVGVTRSE